MLFNSETEKPFLVSPLQIKKKVGRKPNPATPAVRKAQNKAAQQAFRERKEKHLKDLKSSNEILQEQLDKLRIEYKELKDKLGTENQKLKVEVEIMQSENWYLKGIVLTLQLLCYKHNLVIPKHGPFFGDEVLSVLSQSIPGSISAYMDFNGQTKLQNSEKVYGITNHIKPRSRVLSSSFSFAVTNDGIQPLSESVGYRPDVCLASQSELPKSLKNTYCTNPSNNDVNSENIDNRLCKPILITNQIIPTNSAAIQELRLRLQLQNIRAHINSPTYVIYPTLLQLTVPHDPRIDLVPTPHMRDRMILFRDSLDLDDCFRLLIENTTFHGGDPDNAANYELSPEFFDKYWFLTIDYNLHRTTNQWRTLRELGKVENQKLKRPEPKTEDKIENLQPELEQPNLDLNGISSLLDFDLMKFTQNDNSVLNYPQTTLPPTFNQQEPASRATITEIDTPAIEPVLLTDGTKMQRLKYTTKTTEIHKPRRYHPYHFNNRSNSDTTETNNCLSTFIQSGKDCDMLIDYLMNSDNMPSLY